MLKKYWMRIVFCYAGKQKDKNVTGSLQYAANVYHFCLGRMASSDGRRGSATANCLETSLETRVQLVLVSVVNL